MNDAHAATRIGSYTSTDEDEDFSIGTQLLKQPLKSDDKKFPQKSSGRKYKKRNIQKRSRRWAATDEEELKRPENGIAFSVRHVLTRSWLNILLIFVPFGIGAHTAGVRNRTFVFALNALAIVPLTGILTYATENVSHKLGVGLGSLLNITFGNLVELVILVFMLREGHLRIVIASLLGSILVNLLFILGIAIMTAGLQKSSKELIYNQKNTQILVFFMTTGLLSLLIPTSLHACVRKAELADKVTLKFSRGISITLLLIYCLFLNFQIRGSSSGAADEEQPYESVPFASSDDETAHEIELSTITRNKKKPQQPIISSPDVDEVHIHPTVALILLLTSATLVSFCAEFMVVSIEHVIADAPLTEAFLGLIILPLLGNVAELATAVTVAVKQKIDLAINVTVGSAIQISLFMAPFCVLLGWATGKDLSLYFDMFQTVTLLATMLIVNIMLISGRSSYLLGVLLGACYVIIGTGAFYLPNQRGPRVV